MRVRAHMCACVCVQAYGCWRASVRTCESGWLPIGVWVRMCAPLFLSRWDRLLFSSIHKGKDLLALFTTYLTICGILYVIVFQKRIISHLIYFTTSVFSTVEGYYPLIRKLMDFFLNPNRHRLTSSFCLLAVCIPPQNLGRIKVRWFTRWGRYT